MTNLATIVDVYSTSTWMTLIFALIVDKQTTSCQQLLLIRLASNRQINSIYNRSARNAYQTALVFPVSIDRLHLNMNLPLQNNIVDNKVQVIQISVSYDINKFTQ